jgi:hypothetical protein
MKSPTAKSSEVLIMSWFLESKWQVYSPLLDNGADFVLRHPDLKKLVLVQIKHKEVTSKTQGKLNRKWDHLKPPFHVLIIYQPKFERGLILPAKMLRKPGTSLMLADRRKGYETFFPKYRRYTFDLRGKPITSHSGIFVACFEDAYLGWDTKTRRAFRASASGINK